jgi:iron complex transport system ATP-binding protein
VIRLDGVTVSFGDVSVLDGVDLTVEAGEFVGLVGPNGAGKTTLLRTVNGVLDHDSGTVFLDGTRRDSLSQREVSRTVGTVPQDSHVGFSFTAEQIVEMGRTPHRSRLDWGDGAEAVERAMERTETVAFRDRPVDELSGGERQRVLLARALAQEPSALVLDEPTASLDINHQVRVLELVAELVAEGTAAVAAIHDLDLAARFCDRLALLSGGEIRVRGPPETVLEHPHLAAAFDTTTAVTHNPVTGTPTVAALADRPDRAAAVHVVGGGTGGAAAVRALWRAGFQVSLGPVPEGDVAARLAAQLDLPAVTAPAFSEPDPERRADAAELAGDADAVVLTGGPGAESHTMAETTPHVRADLGGTGPRAAKGDGGERAVVESEDALVAAVEECVGDPNPGNESA